MRIIGICVALLFATAGIAQETTDQSQGQNVAAPEPGQTYVREVSGAWQVRCVKAPQGQVDECNLYQLLRQANGNPIAEMTIFTLPAGREAVAGATIVTPLGTLLQRGLRVTIDDAEGRVYPFSHCLQAGCVARTGFSGIDLYALENGTRAILTINALAQPDADVNIAVPLDGFKAAYDVLLDN